LTSGGELQGGLDVLLLDELGHTQIDPRGAELLFQIITEREERASIGFAVISRSVSGEPYSLSPAWSPRSSTAPPSTRILEIGTDSHRLRTWKTSARRKRTG
jgi:hypothetical protein